MRHGESVMNVQGVHAGTSETPLTTKGRKQAKLAGQYAKSLGIDYIVSSPQSRALETAQIIAKEIGYPVDNIHQNSLLIERDYGVMEGQAWEPDLDIDGIADAETTDTILHRAKLAVEFLYTVPSDTLLVVSHGSIGRAIRHHLTEHPFQLYTNRLNNAEIVQWL